MSRNTRIVARVSRFRNIRFYNAYKQSSLLIYMRDPPGGGGLPYGRDGDARRKC